MVLRIYVFKTICTSTGRTDSSFKMKGERTIKNESHPNRSGFHWMVFPYKVHLEMY